MSTTPSSSPTTTPSSTPSPDAKPATKSAAHTTEETTEEEKSKTASETPSEETPQLEASEATGSKATASEAAEAAGATVDESAAKEATAAGEASDEGKAEAESLPVPAGPLYNEHELTQPKDEGAKPSLWKRFRMRARGESTKDKASNNTPKLARDPQVGIRLDSIERKIDDFDATLRSQLEAMNARLEDVWESEEQLSHLADIQDKLDRLAQSHAELTQGIASLRRSTLGLAVLIVLTAVVSALIYSSLA